MDKKEFLIKRNDFNRNLAIYKLKLEKFLTYKLKEDDFFEFDKAFKFMDLFFNQVKKNQANKITFSDNEKKLLEIKLSILTNYYSSNKLALLTNWNNIPWVTYVFVGKTLLNYKNIISEIDNDSLNLSNDDCSTGICLDYYEEQGEMFYDLIYWGEIVEIINLTKPIHYKLN